MIKVKDVRVQVFPNVWEEFEARLFILSVDDEIVATARVYWYFDNMKKAVLQSIFVAEQYRKKGIGLHLQEIREKFIKEELNLDCSWLFADRGSWMQKWYERRGYVIDDYKGGIQECEDWMKKEFYGMKKDLK